MIDSRAKGYRAEIAARDELRTLTGLGWERTPASGALDAKHGMKGDVYIPSADNRFSVEVKSYKETVLNHLLLSGKTPKFKEFWDQTIRQAAQTEKEPLLLFKHDRSKFYVAFKSSLSLNGESDESENSDYRWIYYSHCHCYIALLKDVIKNENIKWVNK